MNLKFAEKGLVWAVGLTMVKMVRKPVSAKIMAIRARLLSALALMLRLGVARASAAAARVVSVVEVLRG